MLGYLWYLLGYDTENEIHWDEEQRQKKFNVLKQIKNKVILLNHVHTNTCKNCKKKEGTLNLTKSFKSKLFNATRTKHTF